MSMYDLNKVALGWHECFPVNLQHIFRTPSYKNTSWGLLLNIFSNVPIPRFFFSRKRSKIWFSNPKPAWLKKFNIVAIQDLIAISVTFFTELPIVLFCLLFVFNNRFIYFSLVCIVYLKLKEKRRSMNEQICRSFLEEYFEGNLELLSFIKRDTCSCDINFNCNISNEERVNRFINFYMKEKTGKIKLKYNKHDKQRSNAK